MNTLKSIFLIAIIAMLLPCSLMAASPYSVALHVGYAHNLTYGSMANFDIEAHLPINQHFEADANVRMSTANTYTFGLQLRPVFHLPVGQLYLEDRVMANMIVRDDFHDYLHALSVGYRMQYVDVQLGMFSRVMVAQPYEVGDEMVCEPFNLLYQVEVFVRPETSPWNLSLALANVDDYQMERMWQPMFYLGGWYDIDEHWRVSLNGKLKLAGMFHLNAHYYASELRAGVEYKF